MTLESSLGTAQTPDSAPRVLAVEDEYTLREMLQRKFGESHISHSFQSAASGSEAAGLLLNAEVGGFSQSASPRLLLTDYNLQKSGRSPNNDALQQMARGELSPDGFCLNGPELVRLARDVEAARGITNRAVAILLSGGNFDKSIIQALFREGKLDGFFQKDPPRDFVQNLLSVLADPAHDKNDPRILKLTTPMRKDLIEVIFSPKDIEEVDAIVGRFSVRLLATGAS